MLTSAAGLEFSGRIQRNAACEAPSITETAQLPGYRDGARLACHGFPAMILARLAVDLQHQGAGLGKALLKDALMHTAQAADIAGNGWGQTDDLMRFWKPVRLSEPRVYTNTEDFRIATKSAIVILLEVCHDSFHRNEQTRRTSPAA